MKKILFIFILPFFLPLSAQEPLTARQWQEDLRFLQQTVHKDYPFLFVKTTEEIFDAEVEKLYKDIPNLEEHEIIVGMARVIALFQYGHMGVGFSQKPFGFHYLPLNVYQFKDGVYVQGVHKDYPQALGAQVLEINSVPIADALKRIYPVVSAENTQYFKAYGIRYVTIPEVLHAQGITNKLQNSVEFTLQKDGKTFTQQFTALPKGEKVPTHYGYVWEDETWLEARKQDRTPLYLKQLNRIYFFEYLSKEKVVYVRHSQIQNDPEEDMQSFYARLFDFIENEAVEKLVLDVRLNGGGNNYLNKPILTGILETKKINQIGRFFVLIGRNTFSACQNLVNELDNYTNVIFVGEPTAENVNFYGDSRPVPLPNSQVPVYLSFAWWQDKPAWENADWLAPAIPVAMDFEDYASNEDPVLQAALEFSDGDFKPNPMRYVTDLFLAGRMQELAQELPRMVKDPRYDFFDFETELNKAGLPLLHSGRRESVQAAIGIFSFVTQLFPDSAKSWNNLAQAYAKVGDREKAMELLEKTISLDSHGEIGKSAKVMLRELRN